MKITMLGTAAIGYPFAFCNCDNCKLARIHKGKSIRKKSSILINDDLIIDIGPDVQTAMAMYDKDMGKVKYLLQTHIHYDHYDEYFLTNRIEYIDTKKQHKLEIYTHPKCLEIMSNKISQHENADLITIKGQEKLNVNSHIINAGETVEFSNYKIKAIESLHDLENGSLLYVITQDNKSIFYATDTPELTDNALNQLSEFKLDVIIMDHNFGDTNYSYLHLNEKLFIKQISKLKQMNIIDEHTLIYGTHISHVGVPYHELAEKRAISNGYHIAYDGMIIEI